MVGQVEWPREPEGESNRDGPGCEERVGILDSRSRELPCQKATIGGEAPAIGNFVAVDAHHGGLVGGDDFVGVAVLADLAVVDPDYAVAESADLVELVGDEDHGAAGAGHVAHFAEAFFLEIYVADGQDFVDEEDFGFEVGGYGEGQADVHAGGVVLYGSVDEFFEFREGDDFVEFAGDVALAHAQDGAGEEGVFAAGELGVKAGADFEEAADAAVDGGVAGGGAGDAGEDFEQGGFAGAVAADQAEDFAFADVQGDVFEGPEGFLFGSAKGLQRGADEIFQGVAEAGGDLRAAAVVFAQGFRVDYGGGQGQTSDGDRRARLKPAPTRAEGAPRALGEDPPLHTKGGAPRGRAKTHPPKAEGGAPRKPNTKKGLDAVGNGALHALEEEQAAEEDDEDGGGAGEELRAGGLAVAGERPAEALDHPGHGVEAVEPAVTGWD